MAGTPRSEVEQMPSAGTSDKMDISNEKCVPAIMDGDLEVVPAEEPEKTYYSKVSVWLMVLFSGLAIGSDG